MNIILLLISTSVYAVIAALPFVTSKNIQLIIAPILGIATSVCWTLISRNCNQNQIPYWGLAFDLLLTTAFFVIPFFYTDIVFTKINFVGALLILAGIGLLKI